MSTLRWHALPGRELNYVSKLMVATSEIWYIYGMFSVFVVVHVLLYTE